MKRTLEDGFWRLGQGLFLLFFWGAPTTQAQNLVPNPSFEEYTSCPSYHSQIDSAFGWQSIGISPDYFNSCADDTVGVPFNCMGYQQAFEGEGYAGLGFYPLYGKEYMQAELTQPLEIGALTCLAMRVSPGGFGIPFWTTPALAADHIGMRLSTAPLEHFSFYGEFEFNDAALFMPGVLSDTSSWTLLNVEVIADSAYQYVQIGNFFTDGVCTSVVLDPALDWKVAYAFVDAVYVSQQPGGCASVTGISDLKPPTTPGLLVCSGILQIGSDLLGALGGPVQARLFDNTGRVLGSRIIDNSVSAFTWDLSFLPEGLYYLYLQDNEHRANGARLLITTD